MYYRGLAGDVLLFSSLSFASEALIVGVGKWLLQWMHIIIQSAKWRSNASTLRCTKL